MFHTLIENLEQPIANFLFLIVFIILMIFSFKMGEYKRLPVNVKKEEYELNILFSTFVLFGLFYMSFKYLLYAESSYEARIYNFWTRNDERIFEAFIIFSIACGLLSFISIEYFSRKTKEEKQILMDQEWFKNAIKLIGGLFSIGFFYAFVRIVSGK